MTFLEWWRKEDTKQKFRGAVLGLLRMVAEEAWKAARMESRPRKMIDREGLAKKFGVSTKTVDRRVKDGTFPPPKKIGGGKFWDEGEFDEWWKEFQAKGLSSRELLSQEAD
jgi:predicted DNA-binding transcriptional regulator AlpA